MSAFYVGEALVIEGSDLDNVAHIDLLIGPKDGPVGVAFANAIANQSAGIRLGGGHALWPAAQRRQRRPSQPEGTDDQD